MLATLLECVNYKIFKVNLKYFILFFFVVNFSCKFIAAMLLLVKCYDIKMVKSPGGFSVMRQTNNKKKRYVGPRI